MGSGPGQKAWILTQKMSLCLAVSESAFTIGHLLGSESWSPTVHICEMELSYITCQTRKGF